MGNKETHIDKDHLLPFIREAKELVRVYDTQNRINPKDHYEHGGVDTVALRLLEQHKGFVAINVKLSGWDIHILGRKGHLSADGFLYVEPETVMYVLEDFKGTTVARFADNLCDVLSQRANNGYCDLKEIMVPNVAAYAKRTKREIEPYLSKR